MNEQTTQFSLGDKVLALKHLDKLYDGHTSKAEVISYYIDMADYILPHIYDKPFSMIHFPNGVGGKNFYQKQCPKNAPSWLKAVKLKSSTRGSIDWCLVNDVASMVYMASRSVIEMHTWFSRLPNLAMPDLAVMDLDPSENTEFSRVQFIASAFGKLLKELGIYALPKTTGSKGIHIYIPIKAATFEDVRQFLSRLCFIIQSTYPKLATTQRAVKRRGDKVYLDAVQNGLGKTIAAPYSIRARQDMPVSTPLRWEELEGNINPKEFNIYTVPDRVKKEGDLFEGFYQKAQTLPKI